MAQPSVTRMSPAEGDTNRVIQTTEHRRQVASNATAPPSHETDDWLFSYVPGRQRVGRLL